MSEHCFSQNPMNYLNLIEYDFSSEIWYLAEFYHDKNIKGGCQKWPDYCYLPLAVWDDVFAEADIIMLSLSNSPAIIAGLGAWRNDRVVYRIPEYMFDVASSIKLPEKLPVDKIIDFSKKGLYLELPGWDLIQGCFIHIEYNFERNEPELRLLLDWNDALLPSIVHLGDWSLKSGIERSLPQSFPEIPKMQLIEMSHKLLSSIILTMLFVMEGKCEFDVVSYKMPNVRGQ